MYIPSFPKREKKNPRLRPELYVTVPGEHLICHEFYGLTFAETIINDLYYSPDQLDIISFLNILNMKLITRGEDEIFFEFCRSNRMSPIYLQSRLLQTYLLNIETIKIQNIGYKNYRSLRDCQ